MANRDLVTVLYEVSYMLDVGRCACETGVSMNSSQHHAALEMQFEIISRLVDEAFNVGHGAGFIE